MSDTVSLIMCVYNSSVVIDKTIEGINNLEISVPITAELVVVNNNCTDDTIDKIRKKFNHKSVLLKIVNENMPGLMYARIRGFKESGGNTIIFVDDDNILEPQYIIKVLNVFKNNQNIGGIGGNVKLFTDGDCTSPKWVKNYLGVYACAKQKEKSGVINPNGLILYGAGIAIRRIALDKVFNSELPLFLTGHKKEALTRGDDSEISLRLILDGWDLWYEKELSLQHYIIKKKLKWDYVLNARRGGGAAEVLLKNYRSIIYNNSPDEYQFVLRNIHLGYVKLYNEVPNMAELYDEGSSFSFKKAYLDGMLEYVSSIHANEYNNIVKDIYAFYCNHMDSIEKKQNSTKKLKNMGKLIKIGKFINKHLANTIGYRISKINGQLPK